MKLDNYIINEINLRLENLDADQNTTFSIINKLKELYIHIIKNGSIDDNIYLDLVSYIIYVGFMSKE